MVAFSRHPSLTPQPCPSPARPVNEIGRRGRSLSLEPLGGQRQWLCSRLCNLRCCHGARGLSLGQLGTSEASMQHFVPVGELAAVLVTHGAAVRDGAIEGLRVEDWLE